MEQPRLRSRLIAIFASLAAGVALGVGGSGGEPAGAAAAATGTLAISPLSHADVAAAGDLSRFGYVFLNPWYNHLIPQLKGRNPQIKVFAYKDMSSTRSYACRNGQDDALLPAGVGYCFANSSHPDWFLVDDQARRCEWSGYAGSWQMDVGNPDYQRLWLENVLAELRRHGWDGVTIDNAMVSITDGYCAGRRFPKYPTQAAYQAATRSFLAYVGPRLRAAGFEVIPNIQAHGSLAGVDVWRDWLQFTSGGVREYWMRWGNAGSHFGGQGWLELQQIFEEVQRHGKLFLTGTPTDGSEDVRSMRWGRASFLLGWNGGPAGFGGGNWHPEWTIEIGTPTGPRYQVGTAWRRDYTEGTAIANISASASQTLALGGTYLQPDGSAVSSVTLPPLTGIVLRASGRVTSGAPPSRVPDAAAPPAPAARPESVKRQRAFRGGYKRAAVVPKSGRSTPVHLKTMRYPRDARFWRWLRWYIGAEEFKTRAREPRIRPHVVRKVPDRWWAGLRRFLAARRS
jgi:hypothetical protein